MDHAKRLTELFGVTEFKEYKDPATGPELQQTGQYYSDLYDRVAARGEQHVERVVDEIARLISEVVQPLAREKYGVANARAIRKLLAEIWEKSIEEKWQRQRDLIRATVHDMGFSPIQEAAVLELVNRLPGLLCHMVARQVGRMSRIPVENAGEVTVALAEMFKEDKSYADTRANS